MGTTSILVKRHLHRLQDGEIFTTRDLLAYGLRSTIDNQTSRLVKKGSIARLARGVFCKTRLCTPVATVEDIADAKMRAWGKQIWREETSDERAQKHCLESDAVYSVSGSTSSFKTYLGVSVVLKKRGPRRMKLGNTPTGSTARQIWNSERDNFTERAIDLFLCRMNSEQRNEFFSQFRLIPAWMNDKFLRIRLRHFGPKLSDMVFGIPTSEKS